MATNGNPNLPPTSPPQPDDHPSYSLSTLTLHADAPLNSYSDVSPAMHNSTTFRYPSNPDSLSPVDFQHITSTHTPGTGFPGDAHIYSRASAPNTSRLESILTTILHGPTITYSSGLTAFHALLTHLVPRKVAIGAGYHGCHGVLDLYKRLSGASQVDLFDPAALQTLGKGDLIHLETPVNPTGLAFDVERYARLAHERGAYLSVDATFAPPPLLDPFKWGADFVMHSGTKYFGGHSDLLCGVLAVSKGDRDGGEERRKGWERDYWGLFGDRVHLGGVMGSMEAWLALRSMRTLELRVTRQSENAGRLVEWLEAARGEDDIVGKVVAKIGHASLQKEDMAWLKKQMPNGFGPVFSFWTHRSAQAKNLPSKLNLFQHATSLGGVESLIEWRKMSDAGVEETLLRVSVGVERWEDLRDDLLQGFKKLVGDGL